MRRHEEFSTIITSDYFDIGIKLSFNMSNKIFKVSLCFSFGAHEKDPSETSVIIHNS